MDKNVIGTKVRLKREHQQPWYGKGIVVGEVTGERYLSVNFESKQIPGGIENLWVLPSEIVVVED